MKKQICFKPMDRNLFIALVQLVVNVFSIEWQYQTSNDPSEWVLEYPQCGGSLQSPINLITSNAKISSALGPINFLNYGVPLKFNFVNNGHSIEGLIVSDKNFTKQPSVLETAQNQTENFWLERFHFHWGQNVSIGSEHNIDNRSFALEIHFVHQSMSGRIAVLAIIFEISERNNTNLDSLVTLIRRLVAINSTVDSDMLILSRIFSLDTINDDGYFRYIGSLTSPPCLEGVIWTVFRKRVSISRIQMEAFYRNEIRFNYRPIQRTNNRVYFISVPSSAKQLYRNNLLPSSLFILFSYTFCFLKPN